LNQMSLLAVVVEVIDSAVIPYVALLLIC
jgi:hypothetical protein